MKKILGIVFCCLLMGVVGCGQKTNSDDVQKILVGLFANKYDKQEQEVTVNISKQTDHYASGAVRLGDGPENAGMFLASDYLGNWEIVWDGNGMFTCTEVEPYHFPQDMIAGCYDESNDNVDENNNQISVDNDLSKTISDLFQQQTGFADLKAEDIKVTVQQQEGKYAKGTVEVDGGGAGNSGGWLASSFLGNWELVWQGNGVIDCALLDSYEFPEDMKAGCFEAQSQQPTVDVPDNDVTSSLKNIFAQKFSKPVADISVNVTAEAQNHVKGLVKAADEISGGMFFATNINGNWEVVWDGNGTYECSLLDQYGFPDYMKEGCI
ncbi:MAG TPA: hypothetical protein PLZ62_02005 [bacterium]|nr:hypothetical protein [bacterium]